MYLIGQRNKMIEQPETQNNVLTSSVSQNPVASELDGDAIDSAVQDVIRKNELNQYKKTPVLTPVQQLTPIENAVNEVIKRNNESNKTALNQSLVSASAKDPDTAAKSQALATSLNVSTGVVDFDIELAKRQKLLRQVEAKNLAEKYPSLAKSFLDKDFAEIAHDDIDNLAKTADLANELRGNLPVGMGSGDKTLFGETATKYSSDMFTDFERGMISGTDTTTYGELAYQAQIPTLTTRGLVQRPDLEQSIQYAESVFSEQEEYRGTWSESFGIIVGQMSSMMVEASAVGTLFGGTALGVGILGPQIALPEEVITVPAAVSLGFTTSLIDQTRKVETGSAFVEYYRGSEDYEPLPYEEAAWAANIVGTLNASIELASTAFFFTPLASALPKAFLKKSIVNAFRKAITKSGATKAAATHLVKSTATEIGTEVVQEGTIVVAREITGVLTEPDFQSGLSTQEGRDRLEERFSSIFEVTLKGTVPLAFITGGFGLAHQMRNIARSQKRQKLITDAIRVKGESKVNKRSKTTYTSYLAEQLSGESLHIGVEQFEQARRKNGVGLQEVEKIIPGITEQVAKAKASGGDVVISTSLYLSELIDTEFGVSIRNDIRADAEGMSINEIAESQEFLKELKSINKQAVEDFKKTNKDWAESAGKIEEEVFAKIKAAGNYTEEEARMLAQWHRDTAVVLASRFGMTPEQFNAKFGLSIESAYTPEQQAPAQQVAPALSVVANDKLKAAAAKAGISESQISEAETLASSIADNDWVGIDDITIGTAEDFRNHRTAQLDLKTIEKHKDKTNIDIDRGIVLTRAMSTSVDKRITTKSLEKTLEEIHLVDEDLRNDVGVLFVSIGLASKGRLRISLNQQRLSETQIREELSRRKAQQAPAQGSFEQASRADLGLGQQAAPAPDSGVFDANNPPVSSEAIFALMDADGKIYYDINATMHGDLVETFPDITDTVIDGGFIVNGKYMMGKSDGGYSAFEGEQKQIDAVRNFTEQANTQGFQESNYRPTVVAWAKEKFGDRTAPDGSTVWQNFTEWFGDSKVVDADGKPMVVYHGGNFDFINAPKDKAMFSLKGASGFKAPDSKIGFFFTPNKDVANMYSHMAYGYSTLDSPLEPVAIYLRVKNPLRMSYEEWKQIKDWGSLPNQKYKTAAQSKKAFEVLKENAVANKHDGFIVGDGSKQEIIAFEPTQIKSAVANTGEFSATDPNILRQELIEVNHKREKTTGRYVGAPDWIGGDTKKLNVLRKKLKALALEGERGRMWYENSSKAILEITGGDIAEAEKIVSLIAIYSPNATVPANTSMALTAYYQWKAGHKINAGFSASDKKAEELLRNNKPWSGIKTNSFYQNLMVEIDPSRLDTGVATMDMWMAIAFDYGDRALDQGPKYKFSEREMQRLASELGWKPHQVQAAIWTAMKGRVDAIRGELKKQELKLGIGRLVTKTDPITGKESEIYEVIPDKKYEHFKLAHKIAMEYTLTPEDINASKYDFSDAMRERTIQMSWEATPSTSTGRSLPGIHGASLKQKFEYLQAVQDVLTENGRDVIADLAGLPQGTTANGFSAWLGDIGAGAQTFVPVPSSGFGKTRAIKPSAVEILDLASAIRGYVLEQDAIVYHTPVWDDAKIRHNGLQLSASRPLTKEEMQTMYSAIHQKFGTWDLAPGYRPDGARIINFTSIPNAEFQKGMIEVIEALPKLFGGGTIETRTFRSDGNYISNDWTKDTNGEGYLKRIQTKRPDIQQRVADLRSRVEAVNRKFEAKYGWDKPASGLFKQSEVPAALYSALGVEVAKLTTKSAIADSWKQQIKGLIAKGVIKEREVFWSGLDNWLDLQEGKITKEQVQAFLAAGGVKVELTRLEDGGGQGKWTFDGDIYETEQDAEEAADSASVQQAQDRFDGDSSINDSYLLMREGETIETFYDEDEARQALAELEDSENASIEERYELTIDGNSYGVYGDRIAAQQDADNIINDWADAIRRDMDVSKVDDDDSNASKFSAYQLPGGTNYREVLVTLPRQEKTILELEKEMGFVRPLTNEQQDQVIAEWKQHTRSSKDFESSHWNQKNVLVHLRLNDRVEVEEIERKRIVRHTEGGRPWRVFAEGADQHQASYATQAEADADVAEYPTSTDRIRKRTLFVEEVQSDWGQQGREKGFVTPIKQEDIDKEETLRNKLLKAKENTSIARGKVLIEQERILAKLGLKDYRDIIGAGERRKELTDAYRKLVVDDKEYAIAAEKERLAVAEEIRASTEYSAAFETTRQTDRVPVAPFVESTNGWLELGLKQIMLEAVNGKYDRVAFVGGDQSVERYRKALTEAVDEVEINKNDDGTYTYSAIRGGSTVQGEQSVSAKRINEVFGKAGSKQLLEQADANPNDIHTISSEDIEIGGEGMRKFYDTIVPQALNKMLKKLGGDKVKNINMITEKPVTQEQINAAERRRDFTESERLTAIYERQQLGRGISEKGQQQTGEQQGFTVTPALAAQVNQGLPLFQSAQNKPARGWFDPKQLKAMLGSKSDITTFFHELAHYYLTVLGLDCF
jgi:hypothetical protein